MALVSAATLLSAFSSRTFAQLRVVASTTDLAAIAGEVGGAWVTTESICRGGQDPHAFDFLPSQVLSVKHAAIYLQAGLDLDLWAERLIAAADNASLQVVDCSSGIAVLGQESRDESRGQHVRGNPHYWLGPSNLPIIARNIEQAMSRCDSEHAADFERNRIEFESRLDSAFTHWRQVMRPCAAQPVVVQHPTWDYAARDFGFVIAGAIESHAGGEPTPVEISRLVTMIRSSEVSVLLRETFAESRIADLLARDTGVQIVVLPSSVGAIPECSTLWALFDTITHRIAIHCPTVP